MLTWSGYYWLPRERDTNPKNALKQSTENDDKLELEEEGKVLTHLPSEGTQLHMATTEDGVTSRDPGETKPEEEINVEAEIDALKPEAVETPATRTIEVAESRFRTHVCVNGDNKSNSSEIPLVLGKKVKI